MDKAFYKFQSTTKWKIIFGMVITVQLQRIPAHSISLHQLNFNKDSGEENTSTCTALENLRMQESSKHDRAFKSVFLGTGCSRSTCNDEKVTFLPLLIQDFKLRSMVHFSASTEVKLVL
jgi:hypothetical protein